MRVFNSIRQWHNTFAEEYFVDQAGGLCFRALMMRMRGLMQEVGVDGGRFNAHAVALSQTERAGRTRSFTHSTLIHCWGSSPENDCARVADIGGLRGRIDSIVQEKSIANPASQIANNAEFASSVTRRMLRRRSIYGCSYRGLHAGVLHPPRAAPSPSSLLAGREPAAYPVPLELHLRGELHCPSHLYR